MGGGVGGVGIMLFELLTGLCNICLGNVGRDSLREA